MTLEIHNMGQGTDEWFRARMGKPTASMFSTVMAKGRGGGVSKTRNTYIRKLAGEILTGEPMDSFTNAHMERGKTMEDEARTAYEMIKGVDVEEVGFIENHGAGASPDGLVGEFGGVEIKTKLPHLMIECHERGDVCPPDHLAQVQGAMWITGRPWWDFVAYWPKMPVFITRVERDDDYISNLASEVKQFRSELDRVVAKMRALL